VGHPVLSYYLEDYFCMGCDAVLVRVYFPDVKKDHIAFMLRVRWSFLECWKTLRTSRTKHQTVQCCHRRTESL